MTQRVTPLALGASESRLGTPFVMQQQWTYRSRSLRLVLRLTPTWEFMR